MKPLPTVLLIEDNEDDVFFLKRAWKAADVAHPLQVVGGGQAGIDYLAARDPYDDRVRHPFPALVLLDLKLPYVSGLEVLTWIRQDPGSRLLPVIMLTASRESGDLRRAFDLGANAYIVKPSSQPELNSLALSIRQFWLTFNEPAVI